MVRVGFVTIGQSPRVDVTSDFSKLLPSGFEFVEMGALDGLSRVEVEAKFGPVLGGAVYVTRLRDGSEVKVSKDKIISRVGECIRVLDGMGVDLIAILCSGEFPEYEASVPIIYPEKVLKGFASSIVYSGCVGVLMPAVEQYDYGLEKWGGIFREVEVYCLSPYTSSLNDFYSVGERFRSRGVKLVIMDCIGYGLIHRDVLRKCGLMAVTPRTVLAKAIVELFSS
ncbi:MAG: AroM family protein [Candidatus Methanomethylicia archaeon]